MRRLSMNDYNPFDDILKDERLIIDSKVTINNVIIITAHLLEQKSIKCPVCNSIDLTRNGKVKRTITDKLYYDYKTIINLTVQKYQCKLCSHIFRDSTSLLYKKERISLHLKLEILDKLRNDLSLTYIAKEFNVSVTEVYNIFKNNVNIERHELPEVLCIDEFKNLRSSQNKYACVLYDPINGQIIDVLESRRLINLNEYFYNIPFEEKSKVKYIISDMYEGFRTVAKHHLHNARHIIDSFHYVRYVNQAVTNIRIKIMNSYSKSTKEYRLLKKYGPLLSLPSRSKKNYESYNPYNKVKESIDLIIQDCIFINPDLKLAYDLKEKFYKGFDMLHYEEAKDFFINFRESCIQSNLDEFKALATTIKDWQDEIINSFIRFGDKRLNNGYLEGINNRIKAIKKIGYGYTNFQYFRNRLMFCINTNEALRYINNKTNKIK